MTGNIQNIPEEMKQYPHWILWKAEKVKGKKKLNKTPYSTNGSRASTTDSGTWATFDEAVNVLNGGGYAGLGFVLTASPFIGIDIDGCVNRDTGEIAAEASDIVSIANSYTELSPSGTGFHIITKGKLPNGARRNDSNRSTTGLGYEMYGDGSARYFTVTGNQWGTKQEIVENQNAIDRIHREYISKPEKAKTNKTQEPAETGMTDEQIVNAAANAKNGGAFLALYSGGWESKYGSQSEADIALCNILAFWSGRNADQMDRLFRNSSLMRPKWDENRGTQTYGEITIEKACNDCKEVYSPEYKKQEGTVTAIRADELQKKAIPAVCWLWDHMLTTGLSLVVGASKIGKSWFALQLALSVSNGNDFLGRSTRKNEVLYLALEDSERRLQNRMNKLLGTSEAPAWLSFIIDAPVLGNGLIEQLEPYVKKGVKLIIIDTLQKVRGSSGNKNAYAADYEDMSILKKFADRNDIAILLVHHTRKMKDDDVFNMISGTNGIMGAADTIMVLMREKRNENRAYLNITGRDVMSDTFVLEFNKTDTSSSWSYVGEKDAIDKISEEQAYDNDPCVQTIKCLVTDNVPWSGTATALKNEICIHTGVELSVQYLGRRLRELQYSLLDNDNILYEEPSGDKSVRIHRFSIDKPLCI